MTTLLNSPLEVGLRVLVILEATFPRELGLDDMLVLDHVSLHSADFDGSESLHPAFPLRSADVGARRDGIRHGVELLMHKGLASPAVTAEGISFVASERAHSVVQMIESPYLRVFRSRVQWAVDRGVTSNAEKTRELLTTIVRSWPEIALEVAT